MQGHQRDFALLVFSIAIHNQRNMFQKPLQRIKILHGVDKFGQIFQPPRGIRGFIQLPHLGIARLIQHHAGKISMMHLPGLVAPTLYIFDKISQRVTRRGSQFIRVN